MSQHSIERPKGIGFFLYDSTEEMICLHKRDKKGGGKWDCFGGGLENRENTKDALSREVFEELGIEIDYRKVGSLMFLNNKEIFFIHIPFWKKSLLRLGEGAGFCWLTIEEALNLNNLDDEALQIIKQFKYKILK